MAARSAAGRSPRRAELAWRRRPAPYLALRVLVLSQAAAQSRGPPAAWRTGHKSAPGGDTGGRSGDRTVTGDAA